MSYTDDDTPDFEGFRAFLMDYCGTAFAAGAGPALIDLARIERADPPGALAYRARAGHKRALTQRRRRAKFNRPPPPFFYPRVAMTTSSPGSNCVSPLGMIVSPSRLSNTTIKRRPPCGSSCRAHPAQ